MSGQDWETVRSRYHDIKDKFISNYPNEDSKEFPNFNSTNVFTKERMAAKIKEIKTAFRKAVHSGGRRSERDRVAFPNCFMIRRGRTSRNRLEGCSMSLPLMIEVINLWWHCSKAQNTTLKIMQAL